MSRASDRLREFHEAFDVTLDVEQRITLHEEEHVELIHALRELLLVDKPFVESTDDDAPEVEVAGRGRIKVVKVAMDERKVLEHVARELADVLVVAYGTAEGLGIDLDAAFGAVMDANMAKLPPCERCNGAGRRLNEGGAAKLSAAMHDGDEHVCAYCAGTGKGKPIKRDDGKVLKPEGWQEPSMAGAVPSFDPAENERAEIRRLVRSRERISLQAFHELRDRPEVLTISNSLATAEGVQILSLVFNDGEEVSAGL